MFFPVVRKGLNFAGYKWSYQLRHVSRIPTKPIKKDETTEDILQSIAVPVKEIPTVDVSKRGIPPSPINETSSTINGAGKAKSIEKFPWVITPSLDNSKLLQHYMKLSKSRLTSLVVVTSMAGYAMAPAPFDLTTFLMCSAGTGLLSAAANSINQYHETPYDAQMSRTKNRILVTGTLTPAHAIGFALVTATTGLNVLYFGVNGLTAALGAGNLLLYTSIYTPMKRFSILNTWVGSIVGAIPPLMGWAGCAGTLDTGAWILAGLLYAWQFPHFNALSWNLRPDYSRAGYRMMAVTNPALCRKTALRYTGIISILCLAAPYYNVTNNLFALETLPLNAYFTYLAWGFYKESDSKSSRKLFRFSLLHLPILMVLFLLNKKRWIFTEQEDATKLLLSSTSFEATSDNLKNSNTLSEKSILLPPKETSKNVHSSGSLFPVAIAAPTDPR